MLVCGVLGLLLHDPLATQTADAGAEMYVYSLLLVTYHEEEADSQR